ncbi:2OG-Fe(II) oxygenase [Allopusillimonas soli]|uniref:2OG-Fe(II) oxygenase n=1 Tax=Allopusillimonas soli TaxID=659016 RepID=A0A853FGF8_9BURK|nr:2OG-Fe(II) oxygenase [Allopusillimonas soli]NYT38967.1 2OG-Fe(II) oxygenase [Allopusillimonas soli]TEA69588.1 2OG-Fe(II) oxygenase [Allopusillimonas soli]
MHDNDIILQGLAEQGWIMLDSHLPQPLVSQLHEAAVDAWARGEFRPAQVGATSQPVHRPSIRGDTILWLDESKAAPPCRTFLQWAHALQQYLNRNLFLGLKRAEFHFARYDAGFGYQKHFDQHRGQAFRQISLTLYLNPSWDASGGGDLVLYDPQDAAHEIQRIQPHFGRMVLFRSALIPHAVLPCTRPRWSLTGWMRNDA